jgi:hypothetical protein
VSVAIPAASLCINRRLYLIATVKTVTTTKAMKRRAIMIDLAIGVGIPVLEMILRLFIHVIHYTQNLICFTAQNILFKDIALTSSRILAASR